MELLDIKMLNTAVERILNREMAELGLTYTQTTVIGYLVENGGHDVCQKDIEYSLGLTRPTVSSILDRMERNGLIRIETQAADHRYKRIRLAEKALAQKDLISAKYRKVKAKIFDGITPEQREQLNAIVRQICENLQE